MRSHCDDVFANAVICQSKATGYGKAYMTYECGQHLLFNDAPTQALVARDSRMHDFYMYYMQQWEKRIGTNSTLVLFTLADRLSGSEWGMVENVGDTVSLATAPKMQAVHDYIAGKRIASTLTGALKIKTNAANGDSVGFVSGFYPSIPGTITADSSGGAFAYNGTTGEVTVADHTKLVAGVPTITIEQSGPNVINGPVDSTLSVSVGAPYTQTDNTAVVAAWFEAGAKTCFTDTAGTQPVVNDGDLVSCIKDSNTGAIIAVQSDSTKMPLFRINGVKSYLDLTGGRSMLSSAAMTLCDGTGQHTAVAACQFTSNTGVQSLLTADTGSGGGLRMSQFLRNNAGGAESIAFNSGGSAFTDGAGAITAATSTVLSERTGGTTVETYINGATNGATTVTGTRSTTVVKLGVGVMSDGLQQVMTGRIYGFAIWKGRLIDTDHTNAVSYFSAMM
jgi:hypothetical protein